MQVEIKLFATLRPYLKKVPDDGFLTVSKDTSIDQVITMLELPEDEIKLVFVNGRHAPRDHILKNGDRLGLFPPVGGG
ncbi:MAG: MoaD/ThiS family protein [Desulfobacterales bacterium]|nr:MoaD/ThiS family protein [Desulfobacterales bacterium]